MSLVGIDLVIVICLVDTDLDTAMALADTDLVLVVSGEHRSNNCYVTTMT